MRDFGEFDGVLKKQGFLSKVNIETKHYALVFFWEISRSGGGGISLFGAFSGWQSQKRSFWGVAIHNS
jgi:hypothetical protein